MSSPPTKNRIRVPLQPTISFFLLSCSVFYLISTMFSFIFFKARRSISGLLSFFVGAFKNVKVLAEPYVKNYISFL